MPSGRCFSVTGTFDDSVMTSGILESRFVGSRIRFFRRSR